MGRDEPADRRRDGHCVEVRGEHPRLALPCQHAVVDECVHELLDEERVAVGARRDHRDELIGRFGAVEQRDQLLAGLTRGELTQVQRPLARRAELEAGAEVADRHDGLGQRAGQLADERCCRRVHPVQVLQAHHRRRPAGNGVEQTGYRAAQHRLKRFEVDAPSAGVVP